VDLPVWAWIAIVLGAIFLVVFVLAIWAYPDDNSF